jgi:serine/threonine protein kinase
VSQSGVAKLADFGASQFKPGAEGEGELETTRGDQTNTLAGTPYFMSPESIRQKGAGRRSDIWSYGMV